MRKFPLLAALLTALAVLLAPGTDAPTITPPALQGAGLIQPPIHGKATYYGSQYEGRPLGCPGAGYYSGANPDIAAVSPARYEEWPCGTPIEVCGPGSCIIVHRRDACPGCPENWVDLSEAANYLVCATEVLPKNYTCKVTLRPLAKAN